MLIETEKRLIDANLNRLREGIRVVEDIARYILNDFALASSLKTLRHKARIDDNAFDATLLQHRDIKNDILKNSTPSEKRRENVRDIAMANFKRSEESARVLEEILKLDSAESQNLNKNNSVRSTQTRPLRGAKNRNQASSSASADFLLEADKRGSPPKSEKRQLLARRGSGAGGAALLRKEINSNGSAESSEKFKLKKPIKSFCYFWLSPKVESLLPLNPKLPKNVDSANLPAITKNNDFAESSAICEIFKAIRYELYDIEIAYFKALEKIENKNI